MFVEHKEVGEVTEAPAKVLKLSEAMRIGATLRPQGMGNAFKDGRSCAWGAAWEGSGHPYQEGLSYGYIAGELWHLHLGVGMGTAWSIALCNDSGATREDIADMLESRGL